jgi:integrase
MIAKNDNSARRTECPVADLGEEVAPGRDRKMVRADLLGSHSHLTINGIQLNIWKRSGRYLARGYYEGQRIGPTLGEDTSQAAAELRRLMAEIESGTFVRPSSEEAKRRRTIRPIPQLTVPELISLYVAEKRRLNGKSTAETYRSRLAHLEVFCELPDVRRRYPLSQSIDRDFAIEFKTFLEKRLISPNGHPNSVKRPMKPKGIRNVLEAARDMLLWSCNVAVRNLPLGFVQPVTSDIIGKRRRKDPLRPITFGLERRLRFVRMSDSYQLLTLAWQYVLPLRPEQVSGLLISDVDWENHVFSFGTRFDGKDFTKSGTSFRVPFPQEWEPLLHAAIGSRCDGPVFLRPRVFAGQERPKIQVVRPGNMEAAVKKALAAAAAVGNLTDNDAKNVCRATIALAGGVMPDELSDLFARVAANAGVIDNVRYYDLRGSVESEMEAVGMPSTHQRYVMGHETIAGGSLDEYMALNLDKIRESMGRYFDFARELISATVERGKFLGLW